MNKREQKEGETGFPYAKVARAFSLRRDWGMISDFSAIFRGFVFNDEECLLDGCCTIKSGWND